jgi:proton-coupled amino acid transporter
VSDSKSTVKKCSCLTVDLFASLIPITEAMKEPHKFPKVLTLVMIGVALLFAGFGIMGYAAYGSDIQTVVIVNLPQDKKFVQVVQFLYTIAIVLR